MMGDLQDTAFFWGDKVYCGRRLMSRTEGNVVININPGFFKQADVTKTCGVSDVRVAKMENN